MLIQLFCFSCRKEITHHLVEARFWGCQRHV